MKRHSINSKLNALPSKKPKENGTITLHKVGISAIFIDAFTSCKLISLYPTINNRKIAPNMEKKDSISSSGLIHSIPRNIPAAISPRIPGKPARSMISANIFARKRINRSCRSIFIDYSLLLQISLTISLLDKIPTSFPLSTT